MTGTHNFAAVDLGASNGRVVLGRLAGRRLSVEVVHRFEHVVQFDGSHQRWDWPRIQGGVRDGLALAAEKAGDEPIASVSGDAWAQDFGLLDAEGQLVYSPVSYRDARSERFPDGFFDRIAAEELVARVGVGVLPITTLCQLAAMAGDEPEALAAADVLLHMADLVHHDLCGVKATDWTLATASQLRDQRTGGWDRDLLGRLGVPHRLLPTVIDEPCMLGPVAADRAPHPKLVGVPVVVGASHDTAAASVAAGPLDDQTVFWSAGTYSMLGCVSEAPIVSTETVEAGCAAVGLAGRRWGLFTSVMGFWVIQQCMRQWAGVSYDALVREAEDATVDGVIALSEPRLGSATDMPEAIRQACLDADLRAPQTRGELARVVFDSMASEHADAVATLERLTGRRFRRVHVVGGGSRNAYLCRTLARTLGVPVAAGPAEAAAVGNILLQARAMGAIDSDEAVAGVLSESFPRTVYEPGGA